MNIKFLTDKVQAEHQENMRQEKEQNQPCSMESSTELGDGDKGSSNSPFLLVEMDDRDSAKRLIKRSMLIKIIIELIEQSVDLKGLLQSEVMSNAFANPLNILYPYKDASFKYLISSFGQCLSLSEQRERVHR